MNNQKKSPPENLSIIFNLLTLAFHRYLSVKEGKIRNKRLELISNLSSTDTDANNYGGTNNE